MENIFVNLATIIRDFLAGLGLSPTAVDIVMVSIQAIAILVFLLLNVLYLVYLERKISAYIQQRLGPNRVGPRGFFQTTLDVIKLLGKEDIVPDCADKWLFRLAPIAIFIPTMMVFAVVPFGENMIAVDLNIGIFYFIAIASTTVMAFIMAGWGSNNKYSLLGGMRTVAQMISYEIPLVFSLLGVVMITGSLKMSEIVAAQQNAWFIVMQPLAFIIFFIAATAELNRAPFDLPEGEQEIVAGPYTEYSGMRFALFFLAEYANMVAMSVIIVTVFLGGWHGPFLPSWLWVFIKMYLVITLFMWLRWTFPRIRVDHLMSFNWKVLLPLAIINIVITGVVIKVIQWF
ncbi:NADH-quinone oxidoreductase subunit NuoH [Desulfitibacter alkalitolerans]|uniref:NADH-quinone oxidoreductase subunit NuoH n=1 Tax=Desulfitibacter alkalitolerans TaxID=264641 RepID=UPI000482E810|nr:NADH-quinone oxidoreductase subunit NuoH [Desulfitibacter alkalitolerans]